MKLKKVKGLDSGESNQNQEGKRNNPSKMFELRRKKRGVRIRKKMQNVCI